MSGHPALIPGVRDYVVGAALCVFIPVPFLDEYAARRCLSAAMSGLANHRQLDLPPAAIGTLTADRGSRIVGCLLMLFWWPIKKLFRTFFFFLTLKDVLDALAHASHRLDMLDVAIAAGLLPAQAERVRNEMDAALSRHRTSPVTRALFGYARPDLAHPLPADALGRALHTNVRFGGGALVRADFLARLDSIS